MPNAEEYRGYFIAYNVYGEGEYTVDVEGNDIWCNTFTEAQEFVDDLYRIEDVSRRLGV